MNTRTVSTFSALVFLLALTAVAAQAPFEGGLTAIPRPGETPGGSAFRVSARLQPSRQAPGHPVVAVIEFSCPQGHYVYADSIAVELGETFAALPVTLGKLRLPPAKSKYDELLQEQVQYLDGRFEGRLVLEVSADAQEGALGIAFEVTYQGCSPTVCFRPVKERLSVELSVLAAGSQPVPVQLPGEGKLLPPSPVPSAGGAAEQFEKQFSERGLLVAVLIAFVAGLGLAISPCVYPMIPITMVVIGAAATERRLSALARSVVYVLGICTTYSVLGLLAAHLQVVFGTVLQHPAVYVALAVVFTVMAVAMFGAFQVQMPASWAARLQAAVRGRWGLLGVFLLGLLSGIAVTPCGAPVVAAALSYVTKAGRPVEGFLIMFAIASGMGTPLVVLGAFGGLVKSLPKSGQWQEVVKCVFGIGLVAGALYFLWMSALLPPLWLRMVVGVALAAAGVFAGAFGRPEASAGAWARVRKALGLLLLVAAAIAFFLPALTGRDGQAGPAVQWQTSEPEALQAAAHDGRPVMIYFWQERCRECARLGARTFPDPQVVEESRNFVCLKFDGTQAGSPAVRGVLDRYGVKVFPMIVFAGPDGEALPGRAMAGYVSPDELLAMMRSVRAQATEAKDPG